MPKTPDGLPALMPERALNYDKLFTQDISDPNERIKRVENAVMDLRHDFEAVLPSVIRLVAVEKDIQQLTEQLGSLLPNEPQNAVMSNASVTAPEGVVSPAVPLGAGSPELPATPPPAPAQAVQMAQAQQAIPVAPMPLTPAEQIPKTAPPVNTPPPVAPPEALQATPYVAPPATTTQSAFPPADETVVPVAASPPPAPPPTPPPQAPPPYAPPMQLQAQAPPVVNGPSPVMTLPADSVQPVQPSVPVAPPVAVKSGGTAVAKMRLGAQPGGKTRLVLDLTGWTAHHSDIDNEEHLLIIELPKTGWNGEAGKAIAGNPLIASYDVQKMDDGGSRLIITLRKNTKVTYDSLLTPQGASGYRVVLDLKASQ